MAAYVPTLKTQYKEQIVPALMNEFGYTSIMQCPKLEKIVINQGMGQAVADKKLIDVAQQELCLLYTSFRRRGRSDSRSAQPSAQAGFARCIVLSFARIPGQTSAGPYGR